MPACAARILFSFAALVSCCLAVTAQEASYPERPITMVVGFAAGGSSDVLARAVAAAMSQDLGQQVVVDNRPGASGHVAAESVAHAAPDGYTIFFGTNGTLGIGPALYTNLRYDPANDLAPVGPLHKLPLLLIVNLQIHAQNLAEFLIYARANPGKLTYASAGVGSVSHLASELFKEEGKVDILHVPYKGGGAAIADLVSGRVSMMLETIPNALPLARSGQMWALAVTTKQRSSLAPEIPTLSEAGMPGFDVSAWTGLFVPAGTPAAIIDRLNAETRKILSDQKYVALMHSLGTDVAVSTPQEFGAFVRDDVARWTKVIDNAGIPKIE